MTTPSVGPHDRLYTFGPFIADPANGTLHRNGARVVLASKSFEVLIILIERRDRVVEKDELLKLAWEDTFVEENNLARHISTLRKALSDHPHDPKYIVTIAGRGYCFVAPVKELTPADLTRDRASSSIAEGATTPPTVAPEQVVSAGVPRNRVLSIIARVALVAAAVLIAGALTSILGPMRFNRSAPGPDWKLWQLTTSGGLESEPSWAPDSQRIAYSSDRGGNFDIWVQSTGDDQPVQLTASPADDWQPAWSPDGRQIAFRSERDGGGIFVVPAAGGEERRITQFGRKPQWSHRGSTLLFYDSNVVSKLYVVGGGGSNLRRVLVDFLRNFFPFRAAWHPDGQRISIYGNHKRDGWSLWTISPDGGTPLRSDLSAEVLTRIHRAGVSFTEFSWSPAGDALYFEGRSEDAVNIWRVGVDPRTLQWRAGPERLTTGGGLDTNIVPSPDGQKLAFTVRDERTRVWSLPFDAANGTILGDGEPISPLGIDAVYPDVPPNGTQLLYRTSRRGKQELWRQTLPNGPSHRLVVDEEIAHPRWSPDGRFVAYRRLIGDGTGAIVLVSADSGDEQLLTTPGPAYRAPYDWSSDGTWILGACERGPLGLRSVCLLRVSSAPRAESQMRVIASDPERNLFQGTFSPDQHWIAFEAADRSTSSTIYVMDANGGRWIPITEGGFWDDKPRWSPDGRTIYFVSNRLGFFDVWGRRFDPEHATAVDDPFRVTNFESPRRRISTPMLTMDLSISQGRMILPIVESSGSVWILESIDR